ncbi:hypothetical protein NP493_96g09005 [Ridgeia piscesae]|uniref:Protein VAC14 homolog n=1 Tax=Ridgeia piscesae TaxID=27915 RepID=A0AAD9P7Z9_RIDPI|nr:hypothetical protein NP493_96g09005 [Ridgeia piscesae]
MNDKDFSPLTPPLVRALNDKLYEKRKVAALDIEKMVREFVKTDNTGQIDALLRVLGQDFTMSHSPNSRKGGLIGLAAVSIAIGKDSGLYVQQLVKPVLTCFFDSDSRVRYYGCESLYNIIKVARGSVLPFFNDIFDGLSRLAADPDQNVRSGAELLDRLMKDIVTESSVFNLVAFIPLLRERIYSKNPFARQFIVSWLSTLNTVPDIDMLVFLPDVLDGLFQILGDTNPEVRKMTGTVLGEFLQEIRKSPAQVKFSAMANILVIHSQATDALVKHTAIQWLDDFVQLSGRTMLPFTAGILTATLPCLANVDEKQKSTRDYSRAVNNALMRLITTEEDDCPLPQAGEKTQEKPAEIREKGDGKTVSKTTKGAVLTTGCYTMKELLLCPRSRPVSTTVNELDMESVIPVLSRHLFHSSIQTRVTAFRWVYNLFLKTPNKAFRHVDELFPLLLKTFSDPSDEVVLLDLEVLAEISSSAAGKHFPLRTGQQFMLSPAVQKAIKSSHHMNDYFTVFILSLMHLFSTDQQLLDDRGSFIIRQLCLLLNAEDIYRCCAETLQQEEDHKFASHMIMTLSTILLTATELFELRTQLKDLKTDASCSLFNTLYKAWCHNPVATVALCFLAQSYQHTADLLATFGDLEVTVEFLTEIDKLVQLIESPIFTYLRLQLLDPEHSEYLLRSLYSILMLLPQSDAFHTLQHRLDCIPKIVFKQTNVRRTNVVTSSSPATKINFSVLLKHFISVQKLHRTRKPSAKSLVLAYDM